MSDGQSWQPPVPAVPPVHPVVPPVVPPVIPPVIPPVVPPVVPSGWVPPPKPGLVPLRPMTLGTILGASFRVLRRNPKPTLGPSLLINLGILVIVSVATGLITTWALGRIDAAATQDDRDAIAAGSIAFGAISGLLVMLLSLVGTSLLQGVIISEVARAVVGERLGFRQIWSFLQGRIGALVGWGFLLGGAIGAVILVGGGALFGVFALFGLGAGGGSNGAVAVALLALGVLVVGGLGVALLVGWLNTKLAFVSAAIVLERLPVIASIRRSWQLTRGRFWRTLGILLLVLVIINVASQVVTTPVSLAGGIILGLISPNGPSDQAFIIATVVTYLVTFLVATIIAAIGLVVQSATQALLYVDARMRSEGLDLELARYVEARQAGTVQGDPYAWRGAGI